MAGIVHVDKRLGDYTQRFPAEQPSCGEDYFPMKGVEHLSDLIARFNKANILRLDELTASAPDDELPPEVEIILDSDRRYECRAYSVRAVDKVFTRKNADPSLDWDVERALTARQRLAIRLEYLRINQVLRNVAIMTNNATLAAAERFDNAGSPANMPITRGRAIVTALLNRTGNNRPNVVRMTQEVLNAIVTSEEFKDLTKGWIGNAGSAGGGAPIGSEDLLAALWNLAPGTVKTCNAVYNIANAGLAGSYRTFLGSDIVFAYTAAPGLRTYGLGAEYRFSPIVGDTGDGITILRVPQFQRGLIPGEDIRALAVIAPEVVNADAGFLLRGCVDVTNPIYGGYLD